MGIEVGFFVAINSTIATVKLINSTPKQRALSKLPNIFTVILVELRDYTMKDKALLLLVYALNGDTLSPFTLYGDTVWRHRIQLQI